jgi:hypothetical protein
MTLLNVRNDLRTMKMNVRGGLGTMKLNVREDEE